MIKGQYQCQPTILLSCSGWELFVRWIVMSSESYELRRQATICHKPDTLWFWHDLLCPLKAGFITSVRVRKRLAHLSQVSKLMRTQRTGWDLNPGLFWTDSHAIISIDAQNPIAAASSVTMGTYLYEQNYAAKDKQANWCDLLSHQMLWPNAIYVRNVIQERTKGCNYHINKEKENAHDSD